MKAGIVGVGAYAACALLFAAATGAASAAPKKAPPPTAPAVTAYSSAKSAPTAEPESTGSVAAPAPAEDANCSRSRKRLWVEGEGWVVRRVTTCF